MATAATTYEMPGASVGAGNSRIARKLAPAAGVPKPSASGTRFRCGCGSMASITYARHCKRVFGTQEAHGAKM